jgi:hypothetical protein
MTAAIVRKAHGLIIAVTAAIPAANHAAPVPVSFAVIVAPDVVDRNLSPRAAQSMFRRRQTVWPDGARVQPVNLPAASAVRRAFSECVLGEAPEAMESYWREMYFHGVLPPHVVDSEQAVVLFVNSTPGAIGYVSACPKDVPVNVVMTFGDAPNCPKHPATCDSLQDS